MKLVIPKLSVSAETFLKDCGYTLIVNKENNETSFVHVLNSGNFYPRFHIYFNKEKNEISLHMDAKQPSYEGASAHSGEYDSPLVEQEMARIENESQKYISEKEIFTLGFKKEKNWWERFF